MKWNCQKYPLGHMSTWGCSQWKSPLWKSTDIWGKVPKKLLLKAQDGAPAEIRNLLLSNTSQRPYSGSKDSTRIRLRRLPVWSLSRGNKSSALYVIEWNLLCLLRSNQYTIGFLSSIHTSQLCSVEPTVSSRTECTFMTQPFNFLRTKRDMFYLKTHFVPRREYPPSRLQRPVNAV